MRGPTVYTTELPVGTRWYLGFTFFNVMSIRGFTSVLIIVEATTHYLWFFPCRHKNAPIDLCLFFFNHLKRQNLPVCSLHSDKDGALIGNKEFCEVTYKQLGIVMESTGGYALMLNGAAEAPN